MPADLMDQARAGDGQAFAELIAPYQRELRLHCYRILGCSQDAEDALQEALLTAWRGWAHSRSRHRSETGFTASPPAGAWTCCGRYAGGPGCRPRPQASSPRAYWVRRGAVA